MTQYVVRTLIQDYDASWQYHGIITHLSKESILAQIQAKLEEVKAEYIIADNKISNRDYSNEDDWSKYNETGLASDVPSGVKDDREVMDHYNLNCWLSFANNTALYLDEDMCDITYENIQTLDDYFMSIIGYKS